MAILVFFAHVGVLFFILVCCTKKNLSTLPLSVAVVELKNRSSTVPAQTAFPLPGRHKNINKHKT
jgi:hypothetical protein